MEVSVDGNPPCSRDIFNDLNYNVMPFYYQTDDTGVRALSVLRSLS